MFVPSTQIPMLKPNPNMMVFVGGTWGGALISGTPERSLAVLPHEMNTVRKWLPMERPPPIPNLLPP